MDAQNAAESEQTKPPAGASTHQKGQQTSNTKDSDATSTVRVDSQDHETKDSASAADDRDSDAETVVLPGRDGHSPSKVRKVRQEDRSDGDGDGINGNRHRASRGHDGVKEESNSVDSRSSSRTGLPVESKKRQVSGSHDKSRETAARSKEGADNLSSAPTSPPRQRRRRHSVNSHSSQSDSDQGNNKYPTKTSLGDKPRSGERPISHKRKAQRTQSDDEDDNRKARRPRAPSTGNDISRPSKDQKFSAPKRDITRNRSPSPPHRAHRRSTSTQLSSQPSNGPLKKRRLPPPLHPTDNYSDESSASGSPRPRHTKTRSLATPATYESAISPVKMPSHKKHLDAHGQTYLARACARSEYDTAKSKLTERPEDLNVADYAGNTPLQIAAIHGCEDIVKLLIDAGCNLDCVNYDKDTPLLDAVDNGHLGVVKLLLDAGVNPRKANVNGEEPIDRVTTETQNAEEIRASLIEAKKRFGGRTKTSEERHGNLDNQEGRDSHAPDSPRRSPAIASANQSLSRRAATVRSTKTRNDLLYMPLDEKTLRQAAGRGDEETVARVLQVKDGCDDPESMVAAARGGHETVIQLLLGLGGAQADPDPVSSGPEEFATPILAAIGQENVKVLDLLLNQQGFDPTRRYKGEAYYEIAKRRQGPNWKEEEDILKKAYDAYKTSHKSKAKSPGRREREREEKRSRREDRGEVRAARQHNSSPPREAESRRKSTQPNTQPNISSPRDKKRSDSHTAGTVAGDENLQKRGLARHRKEEKHPSTHASDRELSPSIVHKPIKAKRTESDIAAMSSEGEAVKPRRKLVSKGELRGEREKQRRSSMASNASTLRDPSSPHEARHDDSTDKTKLSEKYHDRAKALKRDESKDHLGNSGESASKRHRSSLTPDRLSNVEKEDGELPVKRRRLEAGNSEKRQKRTSSSDSQRRNSTSGHDHAKPPVKSSHKKEHDEARADKSENDPPQKDATRHTDTEPSVHIKSEDVDVEMPDAETRKDNTSAANSRPSDGEEERKRRKELKHAREEEEAKRRLELEAKKRAEEIRKRKEDEEARKKEEEEAARKKEEEEKKEAERRRQEEVARQKREEEEAAEKRRKAEEKARLEEEEKAKREAEERKRLEEQKRKEEQERLQKEEEDRLRKEREEREAAEQARRKQEEEEERERRERAHREEMERKRAAREAELARLREEEDRIRLDKLPPLLRWLDTTDDPKNTIVTNSLKLMQGVRYDCIRPETERTAAGREQWVVNTHVALLLGEKDLDLTRCKFVIPFVDVLAQHWLTI